MKQLNSANYVGFRPASGPAITIALKGRISLNPASISLLNLDETSKLSFFQDDSGDYFIGKAKEGDKAAFGLRTYRRNNKNEFATYALALVLEIAKSKDLCLATDKKKTIRTSIKTDRVEYNGLTLYQIDL